MKFGVVIFPGSNCDHDCYYAVQSVIGKPVEFIWHQDTSLKGFDAVILPGGFSYGDYLRTGALAKFSPVMQSVKEFADKGGLVIGICNGFQILTESGSAAWRADAQCHAAIHLQVSEDLHRNDEFPVHKPDCRRDRCSAFRSVTATATTLRIRKR